MARLEGLAKDGYYPAPPWVGVWLAGRIDPSTRHLRH